MNRVLYVVIAMLLVACVVLSLGLNHYRDNAIAYKEQRDKKVSEPFSITDNLMLEPQLQYTWQGLSLDDGQDNAGYVKFGHGSAQHVRAGFRLGSHNDMTFGEGTSSRDTLRDSAKHSVSELPVNWWVQPSVIRTFSSRGDMSMGTAAAGSNMTFSPSRNGTSLDLQAGLEARIRENITLGVQAGYAHSVSGSSAEGYNGQATLNMTF